jgi:hypothetical protein
MASGSANIDSTTLLNAIECLPDLEKLKQDFDIIYFLDLCAAIEAAILYDELHLTRLIHPGRDFGLADVA